MTSRTQLRLRLNRHGDFWLAMATAVMFIAVGFFLGWANNKTILVATYPGLHYVVEPHNILSYMASWDAVDYINIARHGYTSLFWVNWFPAYPLSIRALDYVSPSPLVSAFIVSWISLVGALYFYIKIVRRLFKVNDQIEPLRALAFFALFPTAVFLIAPFSESLFAFLALGSIYFALSNKWLAAALMAMVCSGTHITGIFVVILIGLILWEEHRSLSKTLLALMIGSIGLLSYMAYLWIDWHDPLAFLKTQSVYHSWVQNSYTNLITTMSATNLIFIVLIVVAAVYWWKRRRSLALYALFFLAIPLIGRQYGGFDRYVLMAFPIPLMAYSYLKDRPYRYQLALVATSVAWTYILLQYAAGYVGS